MQCGRWNRYLTLVIPAKNREFTMYSRLRLQVDKRTLCLALFRNNIFKVWHCG